jgi:hypothetical protein
MEKSQNTYVRILNEMASWYSAGLLIIFQPEEYVTSSVLGQGVFDPLHILW